MNPNDKTFPRKDLDEVISPIDFVPYSGNRQRPRYRFRWIYLPIALFLLVAIFAGWFVITAKSVLIEATPITSDVKVLNGFALKLGPRFLMRPGVYPVSISNSGYKDFQENLKVGSDASQAFNFQLAKLPGDISIETDLPGARILIDGADVGLSPIKLDVEAGLRSITIKKDRYLTQDFEFKVDGRRKEQFIDVKLAPAWAEVYVNTEPEGANVIVDGILRGVTPADLSLLQGSRSLTLKLDGFKVWNDRITTAPGNIINLPPILLEKADGLVFIQSEPPGASITVDGKFLGLTPLELSLTPDLTHRVSFFKNGYESQLRTIEIKSEQSRELFTRLTPITSRVLVSAIPADAEVYVNNEYRGTANQEIELMSVNQEIEIRKEGYVPYRTAFTSRPGLDQKISVTLATTREAKLALIQPEVRSFSGAELKLLYPTEFTMGASRREAGRRPNESLREVKLNRPFYIGFKEITNSQFQQFNPDHSSGTANGMSLSNQAQPVVRVTWEQAALYCNWLSEKDGLPLFYTVQGDPSDKKIVGFDLNSHGYRLPSEAEWAWAARWDRGEMLKYAWGSELAPPPRSGNFADMSTQSFLGDILFNYNDNYVLTAPVGTFVPNQHGLYDIAGNVSEWVHDFYGAVGTMVGVEENPFGLTSGLYHTIRGSSWANGAITELRLSFRDFGDEPRDDVGFRVARFLEEELVD